MKKFLSVRHFLFISGLLALFTLLIVRLTDLQIFHGEMYTKRAENNRYYSHSIFSRRGILLDRYGDPLVWNVQKYYQKVDPFSLYSEKKPIERDQALILLASNSASIETDTERSYLYPESMAHALGYVGDATAEDLQRDETLAVGYQIGKAGLELQYDKQLRGRDGKETYEINALGQKQRLIDKVDAQPGADLKTTLDPYLTEIASRYLKGVKGAVVITNAENGSILALTSQPSFDPNVLSQSYPDKEKEKLRKQQIQSFFLDPEKLFFDRAISGAYPPGSIFKLATALAGLENKKIDINTQVIDEGRIKVGEYEFGNWYFRQYGRVEGAISLSRAITRSNDIYFYKVAEWTGPKNVADMARLLGLGSKTGIDLPAETKGLIPDPEWKQKVKNEKWYLGDTYHMGIGQGDILTSPIQIAQMTQAIANSGSLCKVSLIETEKRDCRQIGVQLGDLKSIWEGMVGACSSGGTAYPFFPYNTKRIKEGQTIDEKLQSGAVACKTGTAEFGGADEHGYRKTHAWFSSILSLPDLTQASLTQASSSATANFDVFSHANTTSSLSDVQLFQRWKQKVATTGFPAKITITILSESDDANPFKEGSKDAAPIARKIVDWMTQ
jgi:penicillin-binding protein 2